MEVMEETEADKEAQEELATNEPSDFDHILGSAGGDAEYWAEHLMELSKAKEIKAQIPKGGHKFIYSKEMKALDIQVKIQDMAHKLRGDYKPEKVDHSDIIVNIEATPIKKTKKA